MDQERLSAVCAGLTCTVAVRRGDEKWAGAFGGLKVDSCLPIYSLTKTYLAVVLLRLAEERRLALDTPIARWFPDIAQTATVRQVLNHTAGIPDYGQMKEYHAAVRDPDAAPWTFEQFVERTRGLPVEPGFWYSNVGYLVLRALAERTGGASLGELLERYITTPLGLAHTHVVETREQFAALAPGYRPWLGRDPRGHYDPRWVSHGLIAATADDAAAMLQALEGGRLITAASLEQMLTTVAVAGAPDANYGLGVMVGWLDARGVNYGHLGGGPGYCSAGLIFRRLGIAVTVLAGVEQGAREVAFAVADAITG